MSYWLDFIARVAVSAIVAAVVGKLTGLDGQSGAVVATLVAVFVPLVVRIQMSLDRGSR